MVRSPHNTLMTDKQEPSTDTSTEENGASEAQKRKIDTGEFDIVGALAAVSSLQDMTREAEAEYDATADDDYDATDDAPTETDVYDAAFDIQEFERVGDDDEEIASEAVVDADARAEPTSTSVFPTPPASTLHRGQLASVVPALLLMGVGAYLTFLLTTSDVVLGVPAILALAVGGLGAMLVIQWISSARWATGSLFIGLVLLLTGGTVAFLILGDTLSLIEGYPLLLTAIGLAFVLTDVLVPSGRRVWLVGLLLGIAGLAGLVVTRQLLPSDVTAILSNLLPVAIGIVVVLVIAPLFQRLVRRTDSVPDAPSD